jgi:hypothetical protein
MITELARLAIGLLLLIFHRQVASWILKREERLAQVMAAKGWHVPSFPSEKTIHDVYFILAVFICCFSLAQLWFVS